MGQILHACATTTEAVRRAIQNSQESLRALAKRYGINQKTVAKWKQRETVADLPTGPRASDHCPDDAAGIAAEAGTALAPAVPSPPPAERPFRHD